MNNQSYGFPNVDANYSLGLPKSGSDMLPAFHQSEGIDMNYPQHNFPVHSGDYYGQKQQNDSMLNVANHLGQNVGYAIGEEPSLSSATPNNEPFCSGFSNEGALSLPFPGNFSSSQGDFSLSQPQEFSSQLQSSEFPSQDSVFSNSAVLNNCQNVQQPSVQSVENFPSTSEYVDNTPKSLYAQPNGNLESTNVYPHCMEGIGPTNSYSKEPLPLQDQYTDGSASTFSPCNGDSLYNASSTEEVASQSHCNQNFSLASASDAEIVPSNQFFSEVSSGTVEPTSNADLSLCHQENASREDVDQENCEKVSSSQVETTGPRESPTSNILDETVEPNASGEEDYDKNMSCDSDKEETSHKSVENEPDNLCQSETPVQLIEEPETEEPEASGNAVVNNEQPKESTTETLDDISNSLEKGIEASLEESLNDVVSPPHTDEVLSKPLSPMITLLDGNFDDEETTIKTESPADSVEATEKPSTSALPESNARVTRLRTGALRITNRQYLNIEPDITDDSSQDSVSMDDWLYEDGAEVAPSVADASISVPDGVLQVCAAELQHYVKAFSGGFETVLQARLHCTACGKHVGASPNRISLRNRHKILRVLVCNKCKSFYGVGKFIKDSDGSELYCRWCGQGGEVICCSHCPNVFCQPCILRNFGSTHLSFIKESNDWACFVCNYKQLWDLRATCWGLLTYTMRKKKEAVSANDNKKWRALEEDKSKCCSKQNGRRKPPVAVQNLRVRSSASQSAVTHENDAEGPHSYSGHFLFDNEDFASALTPQVNIEECAEEEDFVDPSQFVQSVLSEPRPQTRLLSSPQMPRVPMPSLVRHTQPQVRPVPFANTNPPAGSPRIVIRQGNLMQPGLLPINNQPNSIVVTGPNVRQPLVIRNDLSNRQLQSRLTARNPPIALNNIDGVRSLEQLQSLDQVPWFRDGIDSIRAVGFALNKRMRELEARFHSLKSKQDAEKVMILGKKLERLSQKTEKRFNKINLDLRQGCRNWRSKLPSRTSQLNPFSSYDETTSDWDDDTELSKPLEKVLIPVSSAALQSGVMRAGTRTIVPPLVPSLVPPQRMNVPPLHINVQPLSVNAPPNTPLRGVSQIAIQSMGNTTFQNARAQPLPVRTVLTSAKTMSYTRVRVPGPKSAANRFYQVQNNGSRAVLRQNITKAVGTILNKRNGANSVSVSLMPAPKRKRLESGSSESSDVMVCPTIPELLRMHKVKPCHVRLERCNDFIEKFLARQKLAKRQNIIISGVDTCESDLPVGHVTMPHNIDCVPVRETVELSRITESVDTTSARNVAVHAHIDSNRAPQLSCKDNDSSHRTRMRKVVVVDEEDDDIEIIHEVNNP